MKGCVLPWKGNSLGLFTTMGIDLGPEISRCMTSSSCSSCSTSGSTPTSAPPLPNPNPSNFKIRRMYREYNYLVVELQYPDCTNYEGRKILVFRGVSKQELRKLKRVDPHFCDGKHSSPIARFAPTVEGWRDAKAYARYKRMEKQQ